MPTNKERLIGKVNAKNLANKTAMEWYPTLVKIFEPYVGKKIEKQGGELIQKIQDVMPTLPSSQRINIYKENSTYRLQFKVSTTAPTGENGCIYDSATIYIGEMEGDKLTKITEPQVYRTDYTVEEVEKNRAAYQAAQNEADKLKSACWPFDPISDRS